MQISKAQSSTMRVESHEVHDTPIVSHQAVQTDERSMETPPFMLHKARPPHLLDR